MTKAEYDDYTARIAQFYERENIQSLHAGEIVNDFTARRCEVCGGHPAGARYAITGLHKPNGGTFSEYEGCTDCLYYAEYGQLDDMTMIEVAQDEQRIWEANQNAK